MLEFINQTYDSCCTGQVEKGTRLEIVVKRNCSCFFFFESDKEENINSCYIWMISAKMFLLVFASFIIVKTLKILIII